MRYLLLILLLLMTGVSWARNTGFVVPASMVSNENEWATCAECAVSDDVYSPAHGDNASTDEEGWQMSINRFDEVTGVVESILLLIEANNEFTSPANKVGHLECLLIVGGSKCGSSRVRVPAVGDWGTSDSYQGAFWTPAGWDCAGLTAAQAAATNFGAYCLICDGNDACQPTGGAAHLDIDHIVMLLYYSPPTRQVIVPHE